jgi:hypothetical protein
MWLSEPFWCAQRQFSADLLMYNLLKRVILNIAALIWTFELVIAYVTVSKMLKYL